MQKCVFSLFTLGKTFSTMLSARHTLSHIDSTFIAAQTEELEEEQYYNFF